MLRRRHKFIIFFKLVGKKIIGIYRIIRKKDPNIYSFKLNSFLITRSLIKNTIATISKVIVSKYQSFS